MPSSATITAFYNFSANTKARAAQVTANFDVFRGHIIPVHVSTATSANNTYDLGSSEYRWANVYATNINLTNRIENSAISSVSSLFITLGPTSGVTDVKYNNTTTVFGVTLTVSQTRNVELSVYNTVNTSSNYGIRFTSQSSTADTTPSALIHWYRDSTHIGYISLKPDYVSSNKETNIPISALNFIDTSVAPGSYFYSLKYTMVGSTVTVNCAMGNVIMCAKTF